MGWLTDLVTEIPALAPVRDKLAAVEARVMDVERENESLRKESETLRGQLASLPSQEPEFALASGVLWKRKKSGGYEVVPCCPTCKDTLADYSGSLLCQKCNWQAPIKSFEAPRVYHELFEQG